MDECISRVKKFSGEKDKEIKKMQMEFGILAIVCIIAAAAMSGRWDLKIPEYFDNIKKDRSSVPISPTND